MSFDYGSGCFMASLGHCDVIWDNEKKQSNKRHRKQLLDKQGKVCSSLESLVANTGFELVEFSGCQTGQNPTFICYGCWMSSLTARAAWEKQALPFKTHDIKIRRQGKVLEALKADSTPERPKVNIQSITPTGQLSPGLVHDSSDAQLIQLLGKGKYLMFVKALLSSSDMKNRIFNELGVMFRREVKSHFKYIHTLVYSVYSNTLTY